ncbi:hypothetical protein [Paraburkholderia aromaticivorans]|uniref:Uncharacterized protein n=1 Tax=Paraburkholderia aromaticivorans TaxID=2026199 RepID=A0A248VMC1_9BURK|nr:hypothetical protein [Paraburkholderia aromaticivorans]ASW00166.1 hypothetical protein CJU94_19650 [Paraburkholderia aromaticivorans]
MQAKPREKTVGIIQRINDLQLSSPYFTDVSSLSAESREWRVLRREVDDVFKVDARSGWELTGILQSLCCDREGMESAFQKSLALGISESNHLNLMVNRLNLGLFSESQQVYSQVGSPEGGNFTMMIRDGYVAGAIFQAAQFAGRAREMGIEWDGSEEMAEEFRRAVALLQQAGIDDAMIARHLDVAGNILVRHKIRPRIEPMVTSLPGVFEGVTYLFSVPVSAREAFEMNMELSEAEDQAGIEPTPGFEVVFEAAAA